MTLDDVMLIKNEQPLDRLVEDGGYTNIFRIIGCIGDSLSSGEFENIDENGEHCYHDMFEYSWGQFIARTCGSKVYNFSKGGMTAKEYINSFAEEKDFFNKDFWCQAYIIALGVNDISRILEGKMTFGSYDDINNVNSDTFIGYYAEIIRKYKKISPDAKFFLVTHPKTQDTTSERAKYKEKHRELLYKLCEIFDNCYVIDIMKYGIDYSGSFEEFSFLNGHMNPMGYFITAKIFMSYIDYIIKKNPRDFDEVGFINTGIKNIKKK